MTMKKIILSLLLAGCASGQVHIENDIFANGVKNEDKYFTHGTKFSYYDDSESLRESYSLGQNIYTPSHKHSNAPASVLAKDRPYSGWLYGEYRHAELEEDHSRTILGLQAGCTGRCSLAKESQVGVHRLLGQDYPTWDKNYSLKSEPGIILEGEKYYDLIEARNFYSDYYALLKLGNIIDNVSLGTSFKYGINFTRFDPEDITFKQTKEIKSPWSYYFFGNAEVRGVAYNHLLEGSLFQDERHTVDADLLVGEADVGIRLGYKNFKVSYNYSVITDEWEGQNGPFVFGGLDFSW